MSGTNTDSGFLERVFKLNAHNTTVKTEVVAGFTTFLTMVYIVFVNPQILSNAGMDTKAVFAVTCLIAAFGSVFMGLFANLPIALAPAMGLNAFYAFVVVGGMHHPWPVAMGAVFWGSVGFLILTLLNVRYWMISNIPSCLRNGIACGIGMLIALVGLKNAEIIVASPATMMTMGKLTSLHAGLGVLGFFIIVVLSARSFHAAVLISIAVTTLIGLAVGDVAYQGIISEPPSIAPIFGQLEIMQSFNLGLSGVIFSFMLVNLFDSSGTLIGVTGKAGLSDKNGQFPRMKQALLVDSVSSVVGAFGGTSSVTAYIESSAGTAVGGRTGLTAVVTGILFFLVIFLSPLAGMVPAYAAAGALIYVGVLMTSTLSEIDWSDLTEATPAFITAVMMPFSFSITEGIATGFITYCVIKTLAGRFKEVKPCVWVVAFLFLLKFVFVDH